MLINSVILQSAAITRVELSATTVQRVLSVTSAASSFTIDDAPWSLYVDFCSGCS